MTTPDSPRGTDAPVLARIDDRVGRITLNRPGAINALNLDMVRSITSALRAWREDRGVHAVILEHEGERGFCAGGDVRFVVDALSGDAETARDFFHQEYRLNHLMFAYPKPIAAFMDGVTMGGGVGLAMPCRFRVSTERTLFAMPETAIGLFPDVGGGWWLPRLSGQAGTWLALTGARIRAADCVELGIATHHLPREKLPGVKRAIVDGVSGQDAELAAGVMETEIARFADEPGPAPIAARRADIDRLFAFDTVEEIMAALEREGGDWAGEQLRVLRGCSPQALKVTLRQMREGARAESFAEQLSVEYRLTSRLAWWPDFAEGVRACLIDKDNDPRWSPATLAAVPPGALDTAFARLPPDLEWTPLP